MLKFSKKHIKWGIYSLLFAGTVFLIFEMFPHNNAQFDMHYELGKPWKHELLTAPFGFPIYKTDSELKAEKDSLKRFYTPYYIISDKKLDVQIEKLAKERNIPVAHYLKEALKTVYQQGIMDNKTCEELSKMKVREIYISDSTNIWHKTLLGSVFTIRSAYDFICNNAPISADSMHIYNINLFLVDNLTLDKAKSDVMLNDLQKKISLTVGMVQAGERIIDKGEIVKRQQFKILNSLKKEYSEHVKERNSGWVMFGEICFIAALLFLFALYLYNFRAEFITYKNVIFFIMMIVIIVGAAAAIIKFSFQSVDIVPFALLAIIVRIFFDSRTALFVHIITVLIVSLFVPTPYLFLLLHIPAGMVAVSSLKQLTHRSQLVHCALFIFLTYALIYLIFNIVDSGSLSALRWQLYAVFAENALLLLFAYILIYIFEKIFGYLSDVTLVELSNINNKLLMEFSMRAPGSFQHIMQVSTLAGAAAQAINANVLLTRAGALYHDIGKMKNPHIFTENQNSDNNNPLKDKSYEEAAQMIIAHVADGVKIAENYGLPAEIIAFIKSHHGKSVARYFYNSALNNADNQEIVKDKFSYHSNKPATKEEAIVMMADAVEAASRSLKEYNETTIGNLVENIINTQIEEHSFSNASITFRNVEVVKRVLKNKLLTIYHSRISYPEIKNLNNED
ncbi:MAG: HDIG domain-containing protein [Prevotellaceae bacterium]|jgi:putative nucleotidyltransferase with HDIG domain|nr:HDIG domain-containing protein [Prevotellaceae bacterium]